MTVTFITYNVSCPGIIEDMMIHAFIVQRTLTMYDTEYWAYHSTRVADEDGDEAYYIEIVTESDKNIDEHVVKEIKEVTKHFRHAHEYCGAQVEYYP